MSKIAIQSQDMSKVFGDYRAVDKVNLSIPEGSIYGFLGPNGAGKSTTVKMLVTLLIPTEGDATILGKSITNEADDVRLQIGVALQESALDEQQTGAEFLETQGRLYALSKADIKKRVEELSALVNIGDAINKRIKTYSGGMKRRIDLASALIHNPKVLFLDEPTTGLDPVSRNDIWSEIRRLNKEKNMTIFLTTQYLEEADYLADKVGIINKGKIVSEDTPDKLKEQIGNDVISIEVQKSPANYEFLNGINGISGIETDKNNCLIYAKQGGKIIAGVVEKFSQSGLTITNMEIRRPTLDDVFLKVTGQKDTEEIK